MKYLIRVSYCLLFIAVSSHSYSQLDNYNYKRELKGITDQWHQIILPNELFGKTSQDLSDLRIFGLTKNSITIEAPYLLRLTSEKTLSKDVEFKSLNVSHNDKGHYYTFEIPTVEAIDQIELNFDKENFDWQITLEGSQDQNEWFTLLQNYRILSIKNKETDFQFTKLSFPSSKYRFFRVFIDSQEKPELSRARITQNSTSEGSYRTYRINKFSTKENSQTRQTEIDVELQLPVPVSQINIGVSDTFDYYRPVTIKYVTDSLKTEQGWKYNYHTLTRGTLNSLEKNEFQFGSTTLQKLKIVINNQDNQPLSIDKLLVRGYIHELVARFTDQTAFYYLVYGNKTTSLPNYDINRFTNHIPQMLRTLELGDELPIEKEEVSVTAPLFVNKTWLWAILIVIMLVLGGFSVKMMSKKQ